MLRLVNRNKFPDLSINTLCRYPFYIPPRITFNSRQYFASHVKNLYENQIKTTTFKYSTQAHNLSMLRDYFTLDGEVKRPRELPNVLILLDTEPIEAAKWLVKHFRAESKKIQPSLKILQYFEKAFDLVVDEEIYIQIISGAIRDSDCPVIAEFLCTISFYFFLFFLRLWEIQWGNSRHLQT